MSREEHWKTRLHTSKWSHGRISEIIERILITDHTWHRSADDPGMIILLMGGVGDPTCTLPIRDHFRPKGFKARFLSLFDNMNFLMATAIHLLFKLPVVHLLKPEKVDAVKSRLLFEVTEQAVLDTSEGSSPEEDEEDDFFKALRSPGPTATEGTDSTRLSNKMGKELESWCSEKQRSKVLEQAMFPALSRAAWVDVFVKYNTAIPSSAAVERLFSQGADIMKAKRASLTSDNFERLIFMKGNMDLLKMELSPEDSE
ncbi:hypothetical protein GWK47_029918 [Chionoecetes opilio]|uniref:HAT C-terminal dimerisation domain-containing protein n=1 Tax=Chionoecetes opilio TaxID=41210 RepID=A0A8J4YL60_CHIOP|nr:hypothetical protein GWK47_029918 [Chionoecetes opilio]